MDVSLHKLLIAMQLGKPQAEHLNALHRIGQAQQRKCIRPPLLMNSGKLDTKLHDTGVLPRASDASSQSSLSRSPVATRA